MTPKRVIEQRSASAPRVWPSSRNSSSSRSRRVGSASARKTSSIARTICDHMVTCQAVRSTVGIAGHATGGISDDLGPAVTLSSTGGSMTAGIQLVVDCADPDRMADSLRARHWRCRAPAAAGRVPNAGTHSSIHRRPRGAAARQGGDHGPRRRRRASSSSGCRSPRSPRPPARRRDASAGTHDPAQRRALADSAAARLKALRARTTVVPGAQRPSTRVRMNARRCNEFCVTESSQRRRSLRRG